MKGPGWAALALAAAAALSAAVGPAAPASGDGGSPAGEPRRALLAGDWDDLARAGQRAGSRGLALDLAAPDRLTVLAAALAAPAADDAVWLLRPLARAARSPDRPIAAAATASAARIARRITPEAALDRDLPLDWLRARLADYRTVALDGGRWADVRVLALETATALSRALGEQAAPADAPYDPAALLADPDPEVRRAALELLPAPLRPADLAIAAGAVTRDADPLVAAVAGQIVCEGLGAGDPPRPVLAALGAAGLQRLRSLAGGSDLPHATRLAIARCLAAAGPAPR
jgi:hypothetical protein